MLCHKNSSSKLHKLGISVEPRWGDTKYFRTPVKPVFKVIFPLDIDYLDKNERTIYQLFYVV